MITDWFAWITSRATAAEATTTGPAALRRVLRLRRERHGEVGADAREGIKRLRLGLVEPAREGRDGDHERDANRQAENREDRAALAPHELAPQITEEEHVRAIEAAEPESHLGVQCASYGQGPSSGDGLGPSARRTDGLPVGEVLRDPARREAVRLVGACAVVEDAHRRGRAAFAADEVVGAEALDPEIRSRMALSFSTSASTRPPLPA